MPGPSAWNILIFSTWFKGRRRREKRKTELQEPWTSSSAANGGPNIDTPSKDRYMAIEIKE
jgi:hypothetical protein